MRARLLPYVALGLGSALVACRSAAPREVRASSPDEPAGIRPVLALTEFDEDGGETRLTRRMRFVDVNSRIAVELSREALEARLLARQTELDPKAVDALLQAQKLARQGLANLGPLAAAADAWAQDPTKSAALMEAVGTVASTAVELRRSMKAPNSLLRPVTSQFNDAVDEWDGVIEPIESYKLMFDLVDAEAQRYREQLDEAIAADAFAILFEARMSRDGEWRNVHLDGFDSYPKEERFKVERWRVAPTPEEKEKFEEMSKVAKSLDEGETTLAELGEKAVRGYLDGITRLLEDCLDQAQADLRSLKGRTEGYLAAEKERVEALVKQAGALRDHLSAMRARFDGVGSDTDVGGLKAALQADVVELGELAFALGTAFNELADTKRFADAGHVLHQDVKDMFGRIKECGSKLVADVKGRALEASVVIGLTDGVERSVRTIGAYGDKVLRHTLDTLPTSTQLDLLDTGQRAVGDGLVFRLGVVDVDPGSSEAKGEATTLAQRHFELEQILVHFESAVTLGFADPNGSANVNSTWQVVPTYSLLLKRGSRVSGLRNRLFDPGFGVHIAALDFDGDDSPELGVGGVVSFLRDYLQAGYGYDVSEDRWYGYFGLSLPMSALGNAANGALR